MNINLQQLANNVVSITPDEQSPDSDPDGRKWLQSKTAIANKIFGNNYAKSSPTLITVSKIELADILTDNVKEFRDQLANHTAQGTRKDIPLTLNYDKELYKIHFISKPPKNVVQDLIESQEFIWGNLYLICHKNNSTKIDEALLRTDIKELLSKSTFLELPIIKSELLASTADACELLWFNPSVSLDLIKNLFSNK